MNTAGTPQEGDPERLIQHVIAAGEMTEAVIRHAMKLSEVLHELDISRQHMKAGELSFDLAHGNLVLHLGENTVDVIEKRLVEFERKKSEDGS